MKLVAILHSHQSEPCLAFGSVGRSSALDKPTAVRLLAFSECVTAPVSFQTLALFTLFAFLLKKMWLSWFKEQKERLVKLHRRLLEHQKLL